MGIRCPLVTEPNEPPECEQEREEVTGDIFTFENFSPEFLLHVIFTNELRDFVGAAQNCASITTDMWELLTLQELTHIFEEISPNANPYSDLCPMLVWVTNNGHPTLAFVNPNLQEVIEVPIPSLLCLAYFFCATKSFA